MLISVKGFKGMIPRVSSHMLPNQNAESAYNCRLLNGDLVPMKGTLLVQTLTGGPYKTIFWLLRTTWLAWNAIVDVVRSLVLGDTTGRIYFTGTDVPRVTNLTLAGAGPAPTSSLKLGVPSPIDPVTIGQVFSGTTPPLGTDPNSTSFDGSTLTGLTIIGTVTQAAGDGNPLPSIQLSGGAPSCAYFDAAAGNQPYNSFTFDFKIVSGQFDVRFSADSTGKGAGIRIVSTGAGTANVRVGSFTAWNSNNHNLMSADSSTIALNTWYSAKIVVQAKGGTTYSVTLTVMNGVTLVFTKTFNTQRVFGTFFGVWTPDASSTVRFDNIASMASGAPTTTDTSGNPDTDTSTQTPQITDYVWTYVNSLGEESAPSPISADVVVSTALTRQITFPAIPNVDDQTAYGAAYVADYGIIGRRLYRASGDPAAFLLVVDETVLTIGVNSYADSIDDTNLQEALITSGWDLPNANMVNLLGLPNGIMAGSIDNQLCLSVAGRPSAWPIGYRLPTETKIVAIGNIDTTIVVATQSFPYLSSGTDPANYGMAKLERSFGCVSKRSLVYMRQIGIVYAAPQGLIAIAGANPTVITEAYFTEQEWMLLNPSSIVASVKDNRYVGYCNPSPGVWRGFEFDPHPIDASQGFVWIDESVNFDGSGAHPDGFFLDDLTGDLYKIETNNLTKFEGSPDFITMRWRSKLFRNAYANAFQVARVKPSPDFAPASLVARLYVDQALVQTKTVTSRMEFNTPAKAGCDYQVELEGRWPVQQMSYSSNPAELD